METTAIILSTCDGGNFAVVANLQGMTEEAVAKRTFEAIGEEFGEVVTKVTFDDFKMLDITGKTDLEAESEDALRVISVERTWIY